MIVSETRLEIQKEIIQTFLTDERKEPWVTVNKRNSNVENKV